MSSSSSQDSHSSTKTSHFREMLRDIEFEAMCFEDRGFSPNQAFNMAMDNLGITEEEFKTAARAVWA